MHSGYVYDDSGGGGDGNGDGRSCGSCGDGGGDYNLVRVIGWKFIGR